MKQIPEVGEIFKGHVPATVQLAHVTFGADSTADVQVGETAEYQLINVNRPVAVIGLWTQVETAFTTSVTATIGDSTTADRFLADTTINPAASGAVLVASTGLTVPYVYSAAQDIKVTIGGATVAAGLCHVYLQYAILED
jgi:hypothetical protein